MTEQLTAAANQATNVWAFHGPDACSGRPCPIHGPSAHHMRDWPLLMPVGPGDIILERACPHGIAHPDPDSLDHASVLDQTRIGEHQLHPCDGCCTPTT